MVKRTALGLTTLLALSLTACGSDDETATDPAASASATAQSETAENEATGACDYPDDTRGAAKDVDKPSGEPAETGDVSATISTSAGDIPITLTAGTAPCTVNSFLSLAEQGYFADTECHRLTTEGIYVLQCGDPSGTGAGGPGYSFDDELEGTESYTPGTLAMANAGPATNGSQFFLVYDDSTVLQPNYTVFGSIDEAGLEVVKEIAAKGTADGGSDGAPAEPVQITAVER